MLSIIKYIYTEIKLNFEGSTMTIGQQIKQYRERAGMTQEQLAEVVGVTQENISQVENDKLGITIDKLNKICDALGVKITDVLEG